MQPDRAMARLESGELVVGDLLVAADGRDEVPGKRPIARDLMLKVNEEEEVSRYKKVVMFKWVFRPGTTNMCANCFQCTDPAVRNTRAPGARKDDAPTREYVASRRCRLHRRVSTTVRARSHVYLVWRLVRSHGIPDGQFKHTRPKWQAMSHFAGTQRMDEFCLHIFCPQPELTNSEVFASGKEELISAMAKLKAEPRCVP